MSEVKRFPITDERDEKLTKAEREADRLWDEVQEALKTKDPEVIDKVYVEFRTAYTNMTDELERYERERRRALRTRIR